MATRHGRRRAQAEEQIYLREILHVGYYYDGMWGAYSAPTPPEAGHTALHHAASASA